MNIYRKRPHCSACGSLRQSRIIAQHNIDCANTGERSYPGSPSTRKKGAILGGPPDLSSATLFYRGRSGRKISHLGAA